MPLYLNVPYNEKDIAKKLGALWDPQRKKWYVKDKSKYINFKKWFTIEDGNCVVFDNIYVLISDIICPKCKSITQILTTGYDKAWVMNREYEDEDEVYCEYSNFKEIVLPTMKLMV